MHNLCRSGRKITSFGYYMKMGIVTWQRNCTRNKNVHMPCALTRASPSPKSSCWRTASPSWKLRCGGTRSGGLVLYHGRSQQPLNFLECTICAHGCLIRQFCCQPEPSFSGLRRATSVQRQTTRLRQLPRTARACSLGDRYAFCSCRR